MSAKLSKLSIRYAKSLFSIVKEQNELDVVLSDMTLINNTIKSSKHLSLFLKSPVIRKDKKLSVLSKVFKDCSSITNLFLTLITKKGREAEIGLIAQAFINQYKVHHNILDARITSSNPLNTENKSLLKQKINQLYPNKQIHLTEVSDSSILGGVIVRLEGLLYDASVKRMLEKIDTRFNKQISYKIIS